MQVSWIYAGENGSNLEQRRSAQPYERACYLLCQYTPSPCLAMCCCACYVAGAGFKGAHLTAPLLLKRMLATFQINDWGLFGDGAAQ